MAQLLEEFERDLEPLLPSDKVEDFKALVRRKLNVLASDIVEKAEDERRGLIQNGVGQAVKDQLHADGPNHGRGDR
jgi:hypothetical protein